MTFPEQPGFGSWQDRVRPGAYWSPSGTRIAFLFEDLTRETDLRRTVFEFPGVDGAYLQRSGQGPRRYPMKCIFSGPTCDLQATAFEAAVLEDGVGRLEHPLYGTFEVVPMGTVKRSDALVSAANQAIVEVSFWPSLPAIYPTDQADPGSEILAALEGFDVVAAQQLDALADLETITEQASFKETIRGLLDTFSGAMQGVSNVVSAVNREVRDAQSIINQGLDVFVGQPTLLAQQLVNLWLLPSRALTGIRSRLEAYRDLQQRIRESAAGRPELGVSPSGIIDERTTRLTNDFHGADLGASAAVAGAASSCVYHEFSTRPEAIEAAAEVVDQLDTLIAWRDAGFVTIAPLATNQLDPGRAIDALNRAVAITAGFLVEVSFTLVPERRIVLTRARTIVDLAGELYGAVDSRIEELIANNDLTGDQILELPAGTEIAYYPETL